MKIDAVKDQINSDRQSFSVEEQESFDHFLNLGKKLRDAVQNYPELRLDIIQAVKLGYYEDESILLEDLLIDESPAFKGNNRSGKGELWRQSLGLTNERSSNALES